MNATLSIEEKRNKNRAYSIATIYGILIIIFLILFGFRAPFPPFEEEGIMINFGNVVAAAGTENPKEVKQPVKAVPTPVEEVESNTSEKILTQEVEETVAIPEPEKESNKPKPKPKETKPKVEPQPVTETPTPTETKEVEEAEPEVIEEALFGGSNNSNTSEGNSQESGNMGQTDGVDEGPDYSGQNSGSGESGIGYSLAGRNMVGVPSVKDDSQKEGKVTLKIKVDKSGKVIKAEYTIAGSTTSDPYLKKLAIEAALKANFNPDSNAPEIQQGTMTFVFKLK